MYNMNFNYGHDNQQAALVSIQAYTEAMKEVNTIIDSTLAFIAKVFRW